MNDYYEVLQVHPRADDAVIRAAYEQLITRYDPAQLRDAAAELQQLATRRRDEINAAYAVLSDSTRRAAYDAQRLTPQTATGTAAPAAVPSVARDGDAAVPDYRPLPPAGRRERVRDFNALPAHPTARGRAVVPSRNGLPSWVLPSLVVAFATFSIVLATLLFSVLNQPTGDSQAALATATPPPAAPTLQEVLQQFDAQVTAAQQVAAQVPENPNAWIELGHALYDSVVVVRERVSENDPTVQAIYIERLPRWLEAADAYRQALELKPDDAVIRAELAISLCYYGTDSNDAPSIRQGLSAAEQAFAAAPEEPRVRLSYGVCLAFNDPPRLAEALEQWQYILTMQNVPNGIQLQAQQLIAENSQ